MSARGRTRTSDTRFRKPVLYPLSYAGAESRGNSIRSVGAFKPSHGFGPAVYPLSYGGSATTIAPLKEGVMGEPGFPSPRWPGPYPISATGSRLPQAGRDVAPLADRVVSPVRDDRHRSPSRPRLDVRGSSSTMPR
jgi:hypothetical protein